MPSKHLRSHRTKSGQIKNQDFARRCRIIVADQSAKVSMDGGEKLRGHRGSLDGERLLECTRRVCDFESRALVDRGFLRNLNADSVRSRRDYWSRQPCYDDFRTCGRGSIESHERARGQRSNGLRKERAVRQENGHLSGIHVDGKDAATLIRRVCAVAIAR